MAVLTLPRPHLAPRVAVHALHRVHAAWLSAVTTIAAVAGVALVAVEWPDWRSVSVNAPSAAAADLSLAGLTVPGRVALSASEADAVLAFVEDLRADDPLVQVRSGVFAKRSNVHGVQVGGGPCTTISSRTSPLGRCAAAGGRTRTWWCSPAWLPAGTWCWSTSPETAER